MLLSRKLMAGGMEQGAGGMEHGAWGMEFRMKNNDLRIIDFDNGKN